MENKCLEIYHQSCKNCNKEIREKRIVKGFCKETVSKIDGLPVRCVGEWSKEKIYRLTQYFGIFANGMKKKWKNKLNYIEICSGPGRCIERESGLEFDGTSLAILNHKSFKLVKNKIFIDNNQKVIETLNKRIGKLGKSEFTKAVEGDFNDINKINSILSNLPGDCLNLVLLDPTDCGIPFSLIMTIDDLLKNTDFIINIAFGTDLKRRNLRNAILNTRYHKSKIKYSNFLGSNDFLDKIEVIKAAKTENEDTLIRLFLKEFEKNISQIGFRYIDYKTVKNYYYLLFASKNRTGLKFWREANRIEPNGQRTINF